MNEVEINYEDVEVQYLATEVIQKLRNCIDTSDSEIEFPLGSNQYIPAIHLALLGNLVEWKLRYLPKLGKIKQFLLSYPFCSQHFVLHQDESNTGGESYVVFENPNVSSVDPSESSTSPITDGDGDELGATVDTDGKLKNTSKEAIEALKSILMTRTQANPVYSMGLTSLNAVSKWSCSFQALGSMKKWILYTLPKLSLDHKLFLHEGSVPGTDVVQLQMENSPGSPVRTVDQKMPRNTLAPRPLSVPFHAGPTGLLRESSNTMKNGTIHSIDAGVNIRDFFHIPLIPNGTEKSYIKSTLLTTEMFAKFVASGALNSSLCYGEGRFNELEWRGDAVLHLEITNIQCACQASLYDVGGLSERRSDAEQRLTLALLFDDFQLAQFVRVCPDSWTRELWKVKGDFLEAMIGELYMRINDSTEGGLPFGHVDHNSAVYLIKRIAQAALERGSMLQSMKERKQLSMAAEAAGGGGLMMTEADRNALIRCNNKKKN